MSINRGKQFEKEIFNQLSNSRNIAIIRLYDVTMGYSGINNPCDFVVYAKPKLILLECKAINTHLLNFKEHIRDNQWQKLLNYSKIPGVEAGILVWFIEEDKTYYIDINTLQYMKTKGFKSFDCNRDIPTCILYGNKKRTYFNYNMEEFIKELKNE